MSYNPRQLGWGWGRGVIEPKYYEGGGVAGGVPDHDSQRKKTPFHISRGK